MSKLPMNWTLGQLSQAAHVVRGITFPAGEKQSDFAHGYVCCLRTTNVQQALEWDDVYYVPTNYVKRDDQIVREGDVLMSMANSYELVGKVARADSVPQRAAFGAFLAAVRPTPVIDGGYLYHFLRSSEAQSKLREGSSQTTNIANISAGRLSELPVPLAPLKEQKRIADKLDSVLTCVDAANERLARVAPLLKRFRQSVLAAATSGRLTEDWRMLNGHLQPWREVRLSDIAEVQGGVTKDAKKQSLVDEEIPYLRVANVQRGYLDLGEIKTIRVPQAKLPGLLLCPGDILFNEGGDLDKLGRGWIWEGQIERCSFQNHVFRARLRDQSCEPKYISWWGNYRGLSYFIGAGKQTTNLASINRTVLCALPISIPPKEEQTEIVRRVEILFAFADRLEARLQAAQIASDRLTPSLLAKAFRGELVPQDPNDEPASELLKRLAAAPATLTRKRGSKTTS